MRICLMNYISGLTLLSVDSGSLPEGNSLAGRGSHQVEDEGARGNGKY